MSIYLYSWEKLLIERALPAHGHLARFDTNETGDGYVFQAAHTACEEITRTNSRSFYMASGFLPQEKRTAIRALYAFCRFTDDIVDLESENPAYSFDEWKRRATSNTFFQQDSILTAWLDTRIRHHIPTSYIEQFLEGVALDVQHSEYHTFEDLAFYCYGVASTVGLMSMSIIGYAGQEAIPYAVRLGVALQMTNILRDVAEDWQRGRLYLPLAELEAFNLTSEQIGDSVRNGQYDDNWRNFMRYQIDRTRKLYSEAWPGIALLNPEGRLAIAAASELYSGILDDIEAHDYDVFTRRAHVSDWKKAARLPMIYRKVRRLPKWPAADRDK